MEQFISAILQLEKIPSSDVVFLEVEGKRRVVDENYEYE